MPLISDGRIVEDAWRLAAGPEDLERPEDLIVPLALWQEARGRLAARNGRLGLRLPNDRPLAPLGDDLGRFALIVLEFPKFTDGRAYSQARQLREQLGFQGELRAAGDVLRDQLAFMLRCGFDSFEVADARALSGWTGSRPGFAAWYQPASDGALPISARRRAAAPAVPAVDPGCAGHWAY